MSTKGLWFVYRSHYEGPLSKRVSRIDAPSLLAWFQEKLADARSAADPGAAAAVADADLGGRVHGFGSLLSAAKEHKLAAPKSTAALRAMLEKHLYVEGGPENIRLDDHTLRVRTDDDEVELAYFFFDDEAVREHGEQIAWLLEEDPALVDGDEEGGFAPPVPVKALGAASGASAGEADEGATYACLLTFHDSSSLPGQALVFPGVRLPGLAAHLRRVTPLVEERARPKPRSPEQLDTWPIELRLLRAFVDEHDEALAPALRRAAAYPLHEVAGRTNPTTLGVGPWSSARAEMLAAAEGHKHRGEPERSIVHEGEHVAILCAHASSAFGYQQWIFFDDRWAAAYPDLAGSLLRYAADWDPFPWAPLSLRSAEEMAAFRQAAAWDDAVEGRAAEGGRRYRPSERFSEGELLDHAKFGLGVVRRVEPTKIEVLFRDATRTLAHGTGG